METTPENRTLAIRIRPSDAVRPSDARRPAAWPTLLDYLSSRFTYIDREGWLAEIEQGRIILNGRAATSACRIETLELKSGDTVNWTGAPAEEPEVDENWSLLLETGDYLFINKPAGLPVHPSGRYRTHTLWNLLLERYGNLSLVNRLDRETSGVVLAAKSGEAAREAQTAIQSGCSTKEYLVLVEGNFACDLDASGILERDPSSPVRKAIRFVPESAAQPNGDPASPAYCRTHFSPVSPIALPGSGRIFTLLRARLYTGRTHQIRATLKSLGYPVVGDKLYGPDSEIFLRFIDGKTTDADRASLVLPFQALHSARFSITLPGGTLEASAPLPAFWAAGFPYLA